MTVGHWIATYSAASKPGLNEGCGTALALLLTSAPSGLATTTLGTCSNMQSMSTLQSPPCCSPTRSVGAIRGQDLSGVDTPRALWLTTMTKLLDVTRERARFDSNESKVNLDADESTHWGLTRWSPPPES